MDFKKWIPLIAILGVVIYAIKKMSDSGSPTQVINRAVDYTQPTPLVDLASASAAKLSGFQQLASLAGIRLQGEQQLKVADKQLVAEKQRLDSQSIIETGRQALQRALSTDALTLAANQEDRQYRSQQSREQNLLDQLRILGDQKAYDIGIQLNAQERAYQRQDDLARRNQQNSLLSAFLKAIGGGGSRAGGSGTGSGFPGTPPINPSRGARPANYSYRQRIEDFLLNDKLARAQAQAAYEDFYVPGIADSLEPRSFDTSWIPDMPDISFDPFGVDFGSDFGFGGGWGGGGGGGGDLTGVSYEGFDYVDEGF